MAASNRDLTIGLISKLDKFDLTPAAKDLEAVGDAARDLGGDVDKTRSDLDAFMDKLRAGTKQASGDARRNLKDAGDGFDDFRQEAGQSGREAAASFSGGFDDIQGFIQETAANAFGGFGPIGAAAGIAAAAGIGFITTAIGESNERVEELTDTFVGLRREGIDPAADAASHLVDELDSAELGKYRKTAEEIGVAWDVVKDALDGSTDAQKRVRDAIREANDAQLAGQDLGQGYVDHYADLTDKLNETETAQRNAKLAVDDHELAQKRLAEQGEDLSASLQGITQDAADMAGAIAEGADAVIDAQLRQLEAVANYEANYKTVLDRLGADAIAWAQEQGDSADEALALLAAAPVEKGQAIVDNYRALGQRTSQANAEGMISGIPAVETSAYAMHRRAQKILGEPIVTPVTVEGPSAAQVAAVRASIVRRFGSVTIPTNVSFGGGRFIP